MSGFKRFKTFANSLTNNQIQGMHIELNNSHSTNNHSPDISLDNYSPNELLQGTNLIGYSKPSNLYSPTNSDYYDYKQLLNLTPKNFQTNQILNNSFLTASNSPKAESFIDNLKQKLIKNTSFTSLNNISQLSEKQQTNTSNSCDNTYKTEMCRTWIETNACPYNEKCRFAHGKKELHDKLIIGINYKQKECKSFHTMGFCNYGSRCHFKHEQRRLKEIERTFYDLKLNCESTLFSFLKKGNSGKKANQMRLPIFKQITSKKKDNSTFGKSNNKKLINNLTNNLNVDKLLHDLYETRKMNLEIIDKYHCAQAASFNNKNIF